MEQEIENNTDSKPQNELQNMDHSTMINSNNRIIYADHNHDNEGKKSMLFIGILTVLVIILLFIIILFALSFLNGSNIINSN